MADAPGRVESSHAQRVFWRMVLVGVQPMPASPPGHTRLTGGGHAYPHPRTWRADRTRAQCFCGTDDLQRPQRRTGQERLPHQSQDRRLPLPSRRTHRAAQHRPTPQQPGPGACRQKPPVRQLRRRSCRRRSPCAPGRTGLRPTPGPRQRWGRVRALSGPQIGPTQRARSSSVILALLRSSHSALWPGHQAKGRQPAPAHTAESTRACGARPGGGCPAGRSPSPAGLSRGRSGWRDS